MTRVLVLGAGGSAAANVIDALRRAKRDYAIVGADASPVRLHLSSADERFVVPLARDAGYLGAVRALVDERQIEVVLAQPDPDVMALGAHRDELGAASFLPEQTVLELAADKARFADHMRAHGVPVPEATPIDSMDAVVPTVDDLLGRYERVWVRARVGAGSKASLPVRSGTQAEAWIRWWVDERAMSPADFMASEMLPGREFAYQSVWQEGELVAGQSRERVEYLYGHLTPSGQTSTPAVARTVALPEIDAAACDAVRALDPNPNGVYCVDIKESEHGEAKITEINCGRFFTTSNFFAAAGLNMPDMVVRCALGERPARRGSSPLEPDLYWIRMVDMGYLLVPGDELDRWPRPHR